MRNSFETINIYCKIMKLGIVFTIVAAIFLAASCQKWAVLVAGSNTYANYRHQSDVFHAYQLLVKKNNFNPEKVITFAYDDIAQNSRNPFKGKVFNKPTYKDPGVDVYEGVKIDYKGKDVDPTIFLQVLLGNKTAVKGKGTGRVLESTADDQVFIYFADHGAPGLIAFPSKYLYAPDLLETFAKMKGSYKKLVFYLETCESGSMFTKLPNNTGIYALSAANPTESSWGTYCSPNDVIQGKHIGSCLGDLFSVSFLECTEEAADLSKVSLQQHFEQIKKLTNMSHVMQWGDLSYTSDTVDEFLKGDKSSLRTGSGLIFKLNSKIRNFMNIFQEPSMIDSRYMKVKTLAQIYARERTPEALQELQEQMISMQKIDNIFSHMIHELNLNGQYNAKQINFECTKPTLELLEQRCGRLTDYGLIYIKYIAQACENNSVQSILSLTRC